MKKTRLSQKLAASVLALLLLAQVLPLPVFASDSLPWTGDQTHGVNEPSVRGYTAQQLIDWTPDEQPFADLLRSRVPLQPRIEPFADTQANPNLSPDVQLLSVMGDYGNSYMDNPAYTDKFGVYTYNFWQYLDYISYWHGTATAYQDRELYDPTLGWKERWFEIGCLNIPNPAWTDAAHKNGVLSLGQMFFSDNDRGQLTYKQMLVKDENGNFPVAEKMIEIAKYYGFDGYFFNQEETGAENGDAGRFNVHTDDFADYRAFMARLVEAGLYLNWYDAVNPNGGNSFAATINNSNVDWLYDRATQKQVTNSFFFDYNTTNSGTVGLQAYLDAFNAEHGTSFTAYDVGFAGIEAGKYKFSGAQTYYLPAQINPETGYPYASIAMLGADFVHHELDSDMQHDDQNKADVAYRYSNDYQWMSTLRERFWWSGPHIDPTNTKRPSQQTEVGKAAYADNRNWAGVASFMTERSVLGTPHFYSNFNTGRGLRWYKDGAVNNDTEWSNISIQDIPVTWQWWQETTGTRLDLDYDYGQGYGLGDGKVFDYTQIGGYNGGSSLVANGTLDAENFLRLYKTEIALNDEHEFEMVYNKSSANDTSSIALGLIFKENPGTVVKVPLAGGDKTNGWAEAEADLEDYAGKTIAAFGLVFAPGADGSIEDWQVNIGSLSITDDSATTPAAPTGLTITEAFEGTDEMYLAWDMDEDYSTTKQYNIYVNDVYVGGKYDAAYYIKHLPAQSGTIRVVPVGADGEEGEAAELAFALNGMNISDITAESYDDGEFVVNWNGRSAAAGDVTVEVQTRWHLMGEPVDASQTVKARMGSATFTGMPVNGDYYTLRIKQEGKTPLTVNGRFIDVECEPYEEEFSWNGNKLHLPMATTRDWRYMRVYEDGKERSFRTTYHWDNRVGIIRGRSTKQCLNFTSTAKVVTIVMEDEFGNLSEPVYLRRPMVDEEMFPDKALREWVLANVGEFGSDVDEYDGPLNLDGLNIKDFTGLEKFTQVTTLSVAGNQNVTALGDLMMPEGITSLNIGGTAVVSITAKEMAQYPAIETLDITGADKLELLDLNGSSISTLITGDAAGLEALFYVDLRGTTIDTSEGADARIFADWIDLNKTDRSKSYPVAFKGNYAVDAELSGDFPNIENVADGNKETISEPSEGQFAIFDLGEGITVNSIGVYFKDRYNIPRSIAYDISDDKENWERLAEQDLSWTAETQYELEEEKTPRYVRVTVGPGNGWYKIQISEIEINGSKIVNYTSAVYYDGQDPADPAALQGLVDTLSGYDKNDYTTSSWQPVADALAAAKEALAYTDPTITKREIAQHTAALTAIMDALVLSGDAQALNDWAEFIWGLHEGKADMYSVASWNALVDAIQNAMDLAAEKGGDLSLDEYNAAIAAIDDAVAGLVKQNKTSLAQWVAMAQALLDEAAGEGEYFESAVANLTEVLGRAQGVMDDDNATQEAIDAMVAELQGAIEQMLQHGNRRSLEIMVARAEALNEADYRSDAWPALVEALNSAKALLAIEEVTQEELNAEYAKLMAAMKALKLRADFTELEKTLLLAQAILDDADQYAPTSIENLPAAVERAKALLNTDASQQEVDEAVRELNRLTGEARLKAKKSGLRKAMATLAAMDLSSFTDASVATLRNALAAAEGVDKNENATQEEVDGTLTALLNAVNALQQKPAAKPENSATKPEKPVTKPEKPVAKPDKPVEKPDKQAEKPVENKPATGKTTQAETKQEEAKQEGGNQPSQRRVVVTNPRAQRAAAAAGATQPKAKVNPKSADGDGKAEARKTPQPSAEAEAAPDNQQQAEADKEALPDAKAPLAAPENAPQTTANDAAFNWNVAIWPIALLLAAAIVLLVVKKRQKKQKDKTKNDEPK